MLTKPDRQDSVHSQPPSLPLRDTQYDPLKDNSPSPSGKPYTHPRVKDTMSPSVEIPDQVTTPTAGKVKPTFDDEGLEEEQELQNRSVNQFENPLQRKLDDEIHEHAAKVMREVSGKRLKESGDESGRPFDPNLICPMCMKKFRIGEIQYFKSHVNSNFIPVMERGYTQLYWMEDGTSAGLHQSAYQVLLVGLTHACAVVPRLSFPARKRAWLRGYTVI